MAPLFQPSQFHPTEWNTAEDKAKFCNRFAAFVQSDFDWEKFTHMVYEGLYQHLDFIAHYNRRGFWEEYFQAGPDMCRFLREVLNPCFPPAGWKDVSDALAKWLVESGEAVRISAKSQAEVTTKEYAIYQRLHAKFADYQPPLPEPAQPVQASLF